MISTTEPFAFAGGDLKPLTDSLVRTVRANDDAWLGEARRWFFMPAPLLKPSEWLEQFIILNTAAARKKRWSFEGREYVREQIDAIEDPTCTRLTTCGGTGSGKTLRDYGILLYEMFHNPFPGLYIMPASTGPGGATSICRELTDTLEESPVFAPLLPKGAALKVGLTRTRIEFGGNDLDFVGAHSANQVGNKRCRLVFLGEQDKTKEQLGREAGTDYLAGERIKGMSNTKIIRGSTPSLEGFGIWKALMGNGDSTGSDCRRRFLPCPHCNPNPELNRRDAETQSAENSSSASPRLGGEFKGWFVLIKDDQYNTALPTKLPDGTPIPFAKMRWDAEAKRKDGSWDMDRVIRSARFECPHCAGHFRDEHRLWADKNGVWIPTRRGEQGHHGYQLASYYAPLVYDDYGQVNFDSTFGGMAQKFLTALENGTIGGYINSDLAEVNAHQDKADNSLIEISSGDEPRVSSTLWWPELSIDRQAKYPGFWYRARKWIASVLRAEKTAEQQIAFLKELPTEQKNLVEKISGTLAPPKEVQLYSGHWLTANLQRTDHWPEIFDWLLSNGLTEKRLTEFFQVEFQGDLIRMIDFICAEKQANLKIGKQGDSELVEFGSADSWEELDEVQRRWKIANPDVICDARFGALDNAEVFAECFRRCPQNGFCFYSPLLTPFGPRGKFSKTPMPGYRPFAEWGWTPALGYPEHKQWPSKEKIRLPYTQEVNDPFTGKMEARQFYQYVFKFDAQWALSELARIRKKYSFTVARDCKFYGHNAEMRPVTMADYNLHMKGYFWNEREACWEAPGKQGGSQSRKHPNHLYDCEKNGAARAVWKGIFRYQRDAGPDKPEGTK